MAWDRELFPEPVVRPTGPIITGHVVRLLPGYAREVKVGQPVLVAVLAAATIARLIGALVVAALRAGSGGSRRTWKDLRKGPEFLVTPLRLRDELGQAYEVEMHGHLPVSALYRGDLVQITTSAQADPALPVKVLRMINLTTRQPLSPRAPTLWSHLGPALLLQSALGLTVAAAVAAAWLQ